MALSGKRMLGSTFLTFLYGCALLQFVRFYARTTDFYLKLPLYLTGHERMPFQERVLPILLMRPMFHSAWIMRHIAHVHGIVPWIKAPFYVLSGIALTIAAIATQVLYHRVSRERTLSLLVFPIFLFTVMWTYAIHNEVNFSYPYDFISLAFFTVGLVCIYSRQFYWLLLIIFLGTFNRETTLFLIGIYVLDAASGNEATAHSVSDRPWDRLRFRQVPWARVAGLFAVWVAIKLFLAHLFRGNDESENYVRILENAGRLRLRLTPALLNICGYLFPIVLLYWRQVRPARFGNYVWIGALWLPVMFYTGVILETRIYGELCSYTAVSFLLIAEDRIRRAVPQTIEPALQASAL